VTFTSIPAGTTQWDVPVNAALQDLQDQITVLRAADGFAAADHGLETWTHDPYYAQSSLIAVNGTAYFVRLNIRRSVTVDTIHWVIATAGATPTANQNQVGLYSSTGTRLAVTTVDASISSSGSKATAITAQALTAGTFVWVAFLFNAATPPTLLRGSSFATSPSINLTAATARAVVNGTGLTALPASITPASNSFTNNATYWAGLEAA
jgi:hypothetical protein